MFSYRVDRDSLQVVLNGLGTVRRQVDAGSLDAMDRALDGIYRAAQQYVPVGSGPGAGKLARSMDKYIFDIRPRQGVIRGKVTMANREGGQLPYAWMREAGGVIKPLPGNPIGRLVWTGEDGKPIFARTVTQAGSHYMEGAAIEGRDAVQEAFGLMLGEVVNLRRS